MSTSNFFTQPGSFELDVPAETNFTVVAVGGGGGGAAWSLFPGIHGVASTVSANGTQILSAAGGAGGAGAAVVANTAYSAGQSPGNFVYPAVDGVTYVGGTAVTPSIAGPIPGHAPGGGSSGQLDNVFTNWQGGAAGSWAGGTFTNLTGNTTTLLITVGEGGANNVGFGAPTAANRGGHGAVYVVLTPIPAAGTPNTLPGTGTLSAVCASSRFILTANFGGHGNLTVKDGVVFAQEGATLTGSGALSSSNTYAKFLVAPQLGSSGTLGGIVTNDIIFFTVSGSSYFFVVADPSISGVLNEPIVAPLNATVTFTPRLPPGTLIALGSYLVSPAFDALQQVFLIGNPVSGTWTLQYGSAITGPLAYDIDPDDLRTALGALDTIGGTGNVFVSEGTSPDSYNVEFRNALSGRYIPPMIADASLLNNVEGPGFCEATVAANVLGSPMVINDTSTVIATIAAQIFQGQLCTTDAVNTPGLQLVANSSQLALVGDLIYDVDFTDVVFSGVAQPNTNIVIAPFAFVAPTTADTISLTDPSLQRLPYAPIRQTPLTTSLSALSLKAPHSSNWKTRAMADLCRTPVRRPVRNTAPRRRGQPAHSR